MREFGIMWRIMAITLFLIAVFVAVSLAWPFNPYTSLKFKDFPEQACTNGPVTITAERAVDAPTWGSLDRARVKSFWEDAETGALDAAGEVPIPLQDTGGVETITSPVLREAPSKTGSFYLYVETTAFGTVGIVPRHSTIATYSEQPIEIIDCEGESAP